MARTPVVPPGSRWFRLGPGEVSQRDPGVLDPLCSRRIIRKQRLFPFSLHTEPQARRVLLVFIPTLTVSPAFPELTFSSFIAVATYRL